MKEGGLKATVGMRNNVEGGGRREGMQRGRMSLGNVLMARGQGGNGGIGGCGKRREELGPASKLRAAMRVERLSTSVEGGTRLTAGVKGGCGGSVW